MTSMGLPMLVDPIVWKDEKGKVFDPYMPLNGRHGRVTTKYFMVEGSGVFPADMLRYDQAWAITGLGNTEDFLQPRRSVVLATRMSSSKVPTKGRWESFGWKVVRRRLPFADVQMITGGPSEWNGYCQRCGTRAEASTPSYFNSQILCLGCSGEERRHPDYSAARNAVERALKRKDKNFLGIGWRG